MIKSLIILVLALALAAGAFVSRPSPSDFTPYIKAHYEQTASNPLEKVLAGAHADAFVKSCTIKDRVLWIAVEKDGKTIYTGAFNRWWGKESSSTSK